MGYRFKSDSEHTRLVKMVNTAVSKSVPMGYRFESDSEYLNVWIEKKGEYNLIGESVRLWIWKHGFESRYSPKKQIIH